MTVFTKLGLFILIPFALSLLSLAAKLLYLLLCGFRRNKQSATAADAELDGSSAQFKAPSYFLFCKSKSRVEPAVTSTGDSPALCSSAAEQANNPAAAEDSECSLSRWPLRALYTIRDEEREGVESDGQSTTDRVLDGNASAGRVGSGRHRNAVLNVEEEEALFSTPCGTPSFCTLISSPPRAPDNE